MVAILSYFGLDLWLYVGVFGPMRLRWLPLGCPSGLVGNLVGNLGMC